MKSFLLLLFCSCLSVAQIVAPANIQGGSISAVTDACNPNNVPVGLSAQCNATSTIQGAQNIDVTNEGIWSSLNPSLATISSSGMATCLAAGTPSISFNLGNGLFVATTALTCGTNPLISQANMSNCPPAGSLCTLTPGSNGVGYAFQFSAAGGVPFTSGNGGFPYQWAVTAGSFAGCGLSLGSQSGSLTGTAATGTCNATVQVTDTQPVSTTLAVTVVIANSGGTGPPNYVAYQGPLILPPPKPPVVDTGTGLINNGATVTDSSYNVYGGVPSPNLSTATRCTDTRSGGTGSGGLQSYASGLGGAGDAVIINTNSTLALVSNGFGGYFVTLISGGTCHAPANGSPPANSVFITKNSDCFLGAGNACPSGAGTGPVNIGPGIFDTGDPKVFWSNGNNDFSNGLWQVKIVFQGTGSGSSFAPNGDFKYSPDPASNGGVIVPTVDYEFGLPLGAQVLPRGTSTFYPYGAYVSYSLVLQGSGGTPEVAQYVGTTPTAYSIGDIIVPGTNGDGVTTNPSGCAFKAQVGGTTAGTGPVNFGSKNPCNVNSVTDGTVKWTGLASTATFVYQNIGVGATSSSLFLHFIPHNCSQYANSLCHPDNASTVNDGGQIIWQNVGPNFVPNGPVGWSNIGGTSTDQTKIAGAFSTNTYGTQSLCNNPKNGACYFYQAGQDTGWWTIVYDTTGNRFALLNHMTGIQSNVTCTGGTGYNCAGGTWVWTSPATSKATAFQEIVAHDGVNLNCGNMEHGSKLSSGGTYVTTSGKQAIQNAAACANAVEFRTWQPFKIPYDPFINYQEFSAGMNHFALGHDNAFPLHSNYGYTLGVLIGAFPLNNAAGNNGGLPAGCGAPPATACKIWSGGPSGPQPTFTTAPYAVSIAGGCQNSQNTTNAAFSIPITAATWAAGSATYTLGTGFTTYTYTVGAYVTIGGITPAGYSGQNLLVATSSAGSFTVAMANPGASTVNASAAVFNQLPQKVYGQLPAAFANGGATGAPDCNISTSIDSHENAGYNPGFIDQGRIGGYTYNIVSLSPQPFTALQGEIMAYTMYPLCGLGGQPVCGGTSSVGTIYRFFHEFNTGTNPLFSVQFGITQFSQDGKYIMFGSDWGCTLGATGAQPGSATGSGVPVQDGSGQLGHLPVTSVPASVQSFCGAPWVASTAYQAGNLINAIGNTTAGNATFDVFQAISITGAGITGTTAPSFKTSNPPTASTAIIAASEPIGNLAQLVLNASSGIVVVVGQKITVSGMTPSGYNCTSCTVTAATTPNGNTTNITYTAGGSGLGNGTVFGSVFGLGSTYTDNQVTWQDVGPPNGRGDAFLVTLN